MKQWVLVLTDSADETVNFLTAKLREAEIPFVRLDTDKFAGIARLAATESQAQLFIEGEVYTANSFSQVWLRRPQALIIRTSADPAEAQHMQQEWSAALEGWLARIPFERWMNHPISNGSASYKIEQLFRAKEMGFSVSPTLVTQSQDEARKFYDANDGAIVVKPLSGGYIDRKDSGSDSVIYTHAIGADDIVLFPRSNVCPTLLQRRVTKKYDVRITVVDDDVHAVALTALDDQGAQRLDIRQNHMAGVAYESIKLPKELETRIRRYVSWYKLRFAAIDMALDNSGQWIFFELNPNGQWAWLDQAGASNIADSFINSFQR